MKASDLFVRCLEEEGVEYIFGVPGEENLDLIDSLRGSSIRLVVTRHEQHAAFMAATYGRLTGRAGVCLATLGPGATNLLTGIAHAQLGGMPLVAITGQKGVKDNWQGTFQLVDVVSTFEPLTKWNTSLVSGSSIPRAVRHGFKVAEDERPGAVHIELPEDVAGETVGDDLAPHRRVRLRRPVPDDKAIRLAADAVQKARDPILILSAGANRKRIGKQLARFLEISGIYGVATQMGKGVLPADHPHSLFALGIHKKDYVHAAIESADLVLTVGYDIVEYPPYVWNEGKDKTIVHIDFRQAEPDDYYDPHLEVIGDVSYTLWALGEELEKREVRFEGEHLARLREVLRKKLHGEPVEVEGSPTAVPVKPQRVVYDVRRVMGRDDVVSLDNGIYKLWFARGYPTYADNTLLLDNALATMGAGLGAAMAAQLVHPSKRVLAVVGDGGFLMNSQDLETAVRLELPLVILVLKDDAYGFIRWKQEVEGLADFGMTFGNPDFVRYAEAYGAGGLRVEAGDRLADVLERAFADAAARKAPVLIECPVDYGENDKLAEDLFQEVAGLCRRREDDD